MKKPLLSELESRVPMAEKEVMFGADGLSSLNSMDNICVS